MLQKLQHMLLARNKRNILSKYEGRETATGHFRSILQFKGVRILEYSISNEIVSGRIIQFTNQIIIIQFF